MKRIVCRLAAMLLCFGPAAVRAHDAATESSAEANGFAPASPALVATHESTIGQLVGTDGAYLLSSIVTVEGRNGTVFASLMGSTDLSVLLVDNEADALTPAKGWTPPKDHPYRGDILPLSVGTEPAAKMPAVG